MRLSLTLSVLFLSNWTFCQSLINSGPMLGYSEMREVAVWVQTTEEAKVDLEYWVASDSIGDFLLNAGVQRAVKDNAYCLTFICTDLEPGNEYHYRFTIDGVATNQSWTFNTQPLWQWRTNVPPTFTLATGSCAYINEEAYDRPGEPYGGDYQIFNSIADKDPDLMIWLGDNTYLREADWSSRSGILHRYSHTRNCPEMQRFLNCCPHYALFDDHDFGPNDADGSFINKDFTREAFELFWANPQFGNSELEGAISQFTYVDVDFFLLDNRTNRTGPKVKGVKETILGEEQLEWFIQALKASSARYKVVAIGGQVLNDFAGFENYARYEERQELLELIQRNKIEGVIFLSGDRHHSELSKVTSKDAPAIYDLTASPLTSTAYDHSDEPNSNRVKGTLYCDRNFATLTFEGPYSERLVTIRLFDSDGQLIWEKKLGPKDF